MERMVPCLLALLDTGLFWAQAIAAFPDGTLGLCGYVQGGATIGAGGTLAVELPDSGFRGDDTIIVRYQPDGSFDPGSP
ncbi:MAG: hypothetical protein ACYTGN_12605 [Planctomycetota bacterium]|jgi:hypothetical protein